MENLWSASQVVLPLFLMMALGYFLRRIGVISQEFAVQCNAVLFKAFLPVLVFASVYRSQVREIFDLKLVLFCIVGISVFFLLLYLIIPHIWRDRAVANTVIQGSFRANCLIFGVPVAVNLYGPSGIGATAMISVFIIVLFNTYATLLFVETGKGWRAMLKAVATNPLLLAGLLGIVFAVGAFTLPSLVETVLFDVSDMVAPLALIVLGAHFHFKIAPGHWRPILTSLLLKLVVSPAIFLPLGVACGLTGPLFVAMMAAFAMPTSVASFLVAAASGGQGDLAGQIVVYASVCSIFTIFLIVYLAQTFGIL